MRCIPLLVIASSVIFPSTSMSGHQVIPHSATLECIYSLFGEPKGVAELANIVIKRNAEYPLLLSVFVLYCFTPLCVVDIVSLCMKV